MTKPTDDRARWLHAANEWIQYARDTVGEIGGWREADPNDIWWALCEPLTPEDKRRLKRAADGFHTSTMLLVGAIASKYRNFDPSPLMEVFESVSQWTDNFVEALPLLPLLSSELSVTFSSVVNVTRRAPPSGLRPAQTLQIDCT